VYPGNVLILDTAIAPCQEIPEMRVASPRAASACPGTFPRSTSSSRPPHPSSRPKRKDLSCPATQSPGPKPGRGASPWAPISPETRPQGENDPPIEPCRDPRPSHPATRAGTGTRPYPSACNPGMGATPNRHPERSRGTSSPQRVSPSNHAPSPARTSLRGVLAHGFNPGYGRTANAEKFFASLRMTMLPGGAT
jgi:hypothetical protein